MAVPVKCVTSMSVNCRFLAVFPALLEMLEEGGGLLEVCTCHRLRRQSAERCKAGVIFVNPAAVMPSFFLCLHIFGHIS